MDANERRALEVSVLYRQERLEEDRCPNVDVLFNAAPTLP